MPIPRQYHRLEKIINDIIDRDDTLIGEDGIDNEDIYLSTYSAEEYEEEYNDEPEPVDMFIDNNR